MMVKIKTNKIINNHPKPLEKTLKKMCKMVGANYDEINFHNDQWYGSFSWTVKQEKKFSRWLSRRIFWFKSFRKYFMRQPIKSRFLANKCADQFIFNYGWKSEE